LRLSCGNRERSQAPRREKFARNTAVSQGTARDYVNYAPGATPALDIDIQVGVGEVILDTVD